jgi:ribonuclease BN (tRNA processing enzyme)
MPYLRPAFPFQFMGLTDGEDVRQGLVRISCRLLQHSAPTLGFRFTWQGCSLAYGADTGPGEGISELAREADLLILEASFPMSHPSPNHLTTAQAGEIARAAHAGRLLLTHLHAQVGEMPVQQREAEVRHSGFAGEVLFAEDLACLELPA